jgi:hypothetical protein
MIEVILGLLFVFGTILISGFYVFIHSSPKILSFRMVQTVCPVCKGEACLRIYEDGKKQVVCINDDYCGYVSEIA